MRRLGSSRFTASPNFVRARIYVRPTFPPLDRCYTVENIGGVRAKGGFRGKKGRSDREMKLSRVTEEFGATAEGRGPNCCQGSSGAIASGRSRKNSRRGLSPRGTPVVSRDARPAIVCNLRPGRHRWRSLLSHPASFRRARTRADTGDTSFRNSPSRRIPYPIVDRRAARRIKMIRSIERDRSRTPFVRDLCDRVPARVVVENVVTRPTRDNLKRLCRLCRDNGACRR